MKTNNCQRAICNAVIRIVVVVSLSHCGEQHVTVSPSSAALKQETTTQTRAAYLERLDTLPRVDEVNHVVGRDSSHTTVKAVRRKSRRYVVDNQPGSPHGPHRQIRHTIPRMLDGDIMVVVGRQRPYEGFIKIVKKKNITIEAKLGTRPVIAGDLFIDNSENVTIRGLTFAGNLKIDPNEPGNRQEDNFGVFIIDGRGGHVIENCRIHSNELGGIIVATDYVRLFGNTIWNNGTTSTNDEFAGIFAQTSSGLVVDGNSIVDNLSQGIVLFQTTNSLIRDNEIEENTADGVLAQDVSRGTTIEDNGLIDNGGNGFTAVSSTGLTVRKNEAIENAGIGFRVHNATNVQLLDNTATKSEAGVLVSNSSDISIAANEARDNRNGIQVNDSSGNIAIDGNLANDNLHSGITVVNTRAAIRGNNTHENAEAGISALGPKGAIITGNRATGNRFGVVFSAASDDGIVERNGLESNEMGVALFDGSWVHRIRQNTLSMVHLDPGTRVDKLRFNNMPLSNRLLGTVVDGTKNFFGTNIRAEHAFARPFLLSGPVSLLDSLADIDIPAPTNVRVTLEDGHVNVSWNGVTGASDYQVHASNEATPQTGILKRETFGDFVPAPGSSLSLPIPDDFAAGTVYRFYVTAFNAKGYESWYSSETDLSQTVVIPPVPQTPKNVRVAVENKSITVRWDPVTPEIAGAQAVYNIFRAQREDGGFLPAFEGQGLVEPVFVDNDPYLGNGGVQVYRYALRAQMQLGGKLSDSSEPSGEAKIDLGPIQAVKEIAVAIDRTKVPWHVVTTWQPEARFQAGVSVGSKIETRYEVHRIDDNSTATIASQNITEPVYRQGILHQSNIFPIWGKRYEVRVRAKIDNLLGVLSDPVKLVVPPAPPEGFVATPISTSAIRFTWQTSTADKVKHYTIYRQRRDGTFFLHHVITGQNTTTRTDSLLAPNTKYCYTITATNTGGEGPQTSTECATTKREPYRGELGWHVSQNGDDNARGSRFEPLRTGPEAARRLQLHNTPPHSAPKESLTIKVHPGVHRWALSLSGSDFDYVRVVGVDSSGIELNNQFVDNQDLENSLPNVATLTANDLDANEHISLDNVKSVAVKTSTLLAQNSRQFSSTMEQECNLAIYLFATEHKLVSPSAQGAKTL